MSGPSGGVRLVSWVESVTGMASPLRVRVACGWLLAGHDANAEAERIARWLEEQFS